MMHKMKLQNDPFIKIKNKTKTIEMRVYDEKRRKINVEDLIEFTNINTKEKMLVKVKNIYLYKDFDELYKNHDKVSIGYEQNDIANPNDMAVYYDEEDINKNGVVGIEIELVNNDIDIKNDYGNFKLRVAAIIEKENKILLSKAKKYNGYVFPGGHIELTETSKEAIIRETKEELQMDFKIERLFCIHENLYKTLDDKIASEIVYYYVLTPLENLKQNNFTITENDKGVIKKHEYEWIDKRDLLNKNANPKDVCKLIINSFETSNNILFSDGRYN